VPAATAAIHRSRDPVDLRVDLLLAEAKVLDEGQKVPEALAKLAEAEKLLEGDDLPAALAARRADVILEKALATRRQGDDARAIALYLEAIEASRALYGPDSVTEAIARHNVGEIRRWSGQLAEALEDYREAARINRARAGDSPRLVSNLVGIASALAAHGDLANAVVSYEQALAALRAQVGDGDVSMVPTLVGLAEVQGNLDRFDDAERTYRELFGIIEKTHAVTRNDPIARYNRAELLRRRGRCADAVDEYRRSITGFEAFDGKDASLLPYPLIGEAQCLVELRRARDAKAPLERALAILGPAGDAAQVKTARDLLRAIRSR
jgi:tetratricopeptide (TPR) repeat protein